ncbi:MAG: hypothetical protein WDW38_004141 [Sanguina aurantia]
MTRQRTTTRATQQPAAQSPRDRRRAASSGSITYGNRQPDNAQSTRPPRDTAPSTNTQENPPQAGQWAASPSWPAVAPSKGGPTSRRDKNGRSSTAYDDASARPSAESLSAAAAAFASARAETSSRNPPSAPSSGSAGPKRSTYNSRSTDSGSSGSSAPAPRASTAPSASRSAVLEKPAAAAVPTAAEIAAERRFEIEDKKLLPVFDAERDEEEYPTYVPRNPGIKDGVWNERDLTVVALAQRQANQAVTAKTVDFKGVVLLGKSVEELADLAESFGQPRYRGQQLLDGVLQGAKCMDDVKTVPKEWRTQMQEAGVRTGRAIINHSVASKDGTRKFLLQLSDGRLVETVGIPVDKDAAEGSGRLTVCVSSQVGCPMRCTFCATGKGGFARNLMAHEIVDQVLTVQEQFGRRVSNIVFMGMGEPLLNLPVVVKACKLINQQLGIGARYLTVSTVGVPNAITRLANEDLKATLAVSLHAPSQALRETLVPSAKAYPLEALMAECVTFGKVTGRRVTFEYTLLAGVNDSNDHAAELAALLRRHGLMSHVNIIPWNKVDDADFVTPSRNRLFAFLQVLLDAGVPSSIRMTRGTDASAACGQLRNQFQKQPLPEFAVPA